MSSGSKYAIALAEVRALETVAVTLAAFIRQRLKPAPRRGRGATLRPGADTPLWLTLCAAVRPRLRPYGAKARLARELALDPSRVSQFFVKQTAMPDAERTLELLLWLGRQRDTPRKPDAY